MSPGRSVKFVSVLSSVRDARMNDRVASLAFKHLSALGHKNQVIVKQGIFPHCFANMLAVSPLNVSVLLTRNLSQSRQNFHLDCEEAINDQIKRELNAAYHYQSLAFYCDRDQVAFPNLHVFFLKAAKEEQHHAELLMKYQNKRGGRVGFDSIKPPPEIKDSSSIVDLISSALQLEREVNQSLLSLHALSEKHGDAHLCDFLESEFLEEQVESIRELAHLLTRATRCERGLGEFVFDQEVFNKL